MTRFGYTLMTEQSGPKDLVRYAQAAEDAGFDLAVSSDHYSPWLSAQGHAPYAWTVLGAVAQATQRIELMTYVTCPTMRYHPAVVAQKAATLQLLADGRFTLGLGSGENLNEHVVGEGWPGVDTRQAMLAEAIQVIRALHAGDLVTFRGDYFGVDSARIWDLPERGVARRGRGRGKAVERARPARRPPHRHGPEGGARRTPGTPSTGRRVGSGARAIGQIPDQLGPVQRAGGVDRAHEQFRWFAGGWSVNADLPTTAGFAGASQFVRKEDVADSIPCGPDLDAIVEAVKPFWEAGFTDIALVQVGDELQDRFLSEAAEPLLEKLRAAAPR